MNFIKNSADKNPIVDTVFSIVRKAVAAKEQYGAENVTDATLGSLYSEDGALVAMESVFKSSASLTMDSPLCRKYSMTSPGSL